VGAWTYWLLLFGVAPALWLISIRLLATRAERPRSGARGAVTVGLVGLATAGTWALITPAFDAPDEPDHYSYVQTLAETGNAPERTPGHLGGYSTRLVAALDSLRVYARVEQPNERPPWLHYDELRFGHRVRTGPNKPGDGGGYLPATSVHAPPYYALEALPYLATKSANIFTQLTAMRWLSALLGAFTAALTFLTVRELFPRQEWLAAAAGLLVAFHPMFTFIAGAVNNDNGVNAAAALLVYLLVRGLRRGVSVPLGLAIGATLVVLPLVKGTGYGLYPAALAAFVGMAWRRHRARDLPGYGALAGAAAAAYGAWTAISGSFDRSAFTTPGGVSPTSSNGLAGNVLQQPLIYANYVWQTFLPRIPGTKDVTAKRWPAYDIYVERGWAAFGWYAMRFPMWVYVVVALVMLAAGALCALAVWRERVAARLRGWELVVLVVVIAGVIGGVEAAYFTDTPRSVVSEQGRYAFTAIVPLATVAVGACCAFGRRRAPLAAGVLVGGMMGLALAAQMLAVTRFFM
jgi:4-amino-4-deoxy-L-arabinose transferase-like glycosyltransferase